MKLEQENSCLAPEYETIMTRLAMLASLRLHHIEARCDAERRAAEAEESRRLLEERMAELERANDSLKARILQHEQAEESLKESESHLRFFAAKLLLMREEERCRLAQELDHAVINKLLEMKCQTEAALRAKGRGRTQKMARTLETLLPATHQVIEEMENICRDFRPLILDDLGLKATIEWFCRGFQESYSHIQLDLEIDLHEKDAPDALNIVIYRIVQEALTTIAHHSESNRAWLSLRKIHDRVELVITDKGVGFDVDAVLVAGRDGSRRAGLSRMERQTRSSGGSFAVESAQGGGTTVRASWPLTESSPAD